LARAIRAAPAQADELRAVARNIEQELATELAREGLFGRDPIAIKVDDMRVALRRHEAASLTVRFKPALVAGAGFLPEEVPA
jgi:ferrous iron transport protein A